MQSLPTHPLIDNALLKPAPRPSPIHNNDVEEGSETYGDSGAKKKRIKANPETNKTKVPSPSSSTMPSVAASASAKWYADWFENKYDFPFLLEIVQYVCLAWNYHMSLGVDIVSGTL